jgi:hypothetical protein
MRSLWRDDFAPCGESRGGKPMSKKSGEIEIRDSSLVEARYRPCRRSHRGVRATVSPRNDALLIPRRNRRHVPHNLGRWGSILPAARHSQSLCPSPSSPSPLADRAVPSQLTATRVVFAAQNRRAADLIAGGKRERSGRERILVIQGLRLHFAEKCHAPVDFTTFDST